MADYLEIYKKFKEVKEVSDYIEDVNTLRNYYNTQQFEQMCEHIKQLTAKYFVETLVWNSVNNNPPQTYEQAYINAENFLCKQGAIMIAKKVINYTQRLSQEESTLVESLIKLKE